MMEDFDSNNNVRSSIPVQFLAQVWTPSLNPSTSAIYPDWFADDHDHDDLPVARGRRSTRQPAYCGAVPSFVTPPTPEDGAVLNYNSGSVSFVLKASTENGHIAKFDYQAGTDIDMVLTFLF